MRAEALISETLQLEESRFRTTLARGLTILDAETAGLKAGDSLKGSVAFTLYDTFGFPLDLTQDALRARDIGVDTDGFTLAMNEQKAKARAAWSGSGEAATDTVWFGLRDKVGASEFLGYSSDVAEGVITALVSGGAEVGALTAGETGLVLFNQTPFYAESGGQVGDTGTVHGDGFSAKVTDTQKKVGDVFAHEVRVTAGELRVGKATELVVDAARRSAIRANHSATHLLHEALRLTLGDHVAQKGSMVSPDRLRFDFSHPKGISDADLERVEAIANRIVLQNEPVVTRLMGVDDAIASGARALFGEKYGEEVRVVSMGTVREGALPGTVREGALSGTVREGALPGTVREGALPGTVREGDHAGQNYSVELCGGTHASATGDIGLITIIHEGAVAAGVRRLEAMTGDAARQHLAQDSRRLQQLAGLMKTTPAEAADRLASLLEERRKLERELSDAKRKLAMGGGAAASNPVKDIGGVKFIGRVISGVEMKDLKSLADEAKKQLVSGVVAIVGVAEDGKAGVVVAITENMAAQFDAVSLVRAASVALGGKGGGGRRDMAQAGGPDGDKAEAAIAAVEAALSV